MNKQHQKTQRKKLNAARPVALWIRDGLSRKGWKVADLHRATKYSKGWLSRITYKNGINTTTGAYSRPGEEKIDFIAEKLEIDANEGRLAAGYAPVSEELNRFVIGEFKGKPVEVMLRATPTEEQLQRVRLAVEIIFSDANGDRKGSGR